MISLKDECIITGSYNSEARVQLKADCNTGNSWVVEMASKGSIGSNARGTGLGWQGSG